MAKGRRLPLFLLGLCLLAGCAASTIESPQPTAAPTPSPAAEATPTPEPTPDRGNLTEDEVDRVNAAFSYEAQDWEGGFTGFLEVSGFFTSYYTDVRELNLKEFLWYYPGDGSLEEKDEAEFAALAALPEFPWTAEAAEKAGWEAVTIRTIPVPVHRILRSSVDGTLKKYAGITTADLKDPGWVLYVPEYGAYYTFTSDFGPGSFTCEGGRVEGDIAVLWSEERDMHGNRDELTLQKEGENWYIRSFLRSPAAESPAEEPPPPNIDEEAYARYRDTVNDYFDRDVEETNLRREEYGLEWPTIAGWELSDFYLAGEKEELGIQAYRMESLWYTDPPEKIFEMVAGGAYVDSCLRLHGNHWKLTYLAVLDGEPTGIFHLSGELDMDEFDTQQEFLDMMAENTEVGG